MKKQENVEDEEGQQTLTVIEGMSAKLGEIELPKIDITPYIGRKVKILDVDVCKSTKFGGGYVARIKTEVVDIIKGGKNDIPLQGSRIFGLQSDKNGNVGWGADTKLGLFLKSMHCEDLEQLRGKVVILQARTAQNGNKFLTFD